MGDGATRAWLLVALLSASPSAAADELTSAKEHFQRGTKLYDLGRYLEAAKEYEATYELKDDPALLFNIGQAYRLGGDAAAAMRAYKSFLRRVPDSEQRPQIEAHLRALQEELDRHPPPATTTSGTTTTAPPATTTSAPATSAPSPSSAPASAERPLYKKWWLWTIVGGVVVAGVAVGVAVAVTAGHDSFHPSLGKLGPAALTVSF